MSETTIQNKIRLEVGKIFGVRLFRNNVGNSYQGIPVTCKPNEPLILRAWRRIQYGLFPGSSDLIGWRSITITPEMVGKTVAVFTSIEVKSETGSISPAQRNWIGQVILSGGISGIARNEDDAKTLINEYTDRWIIIDKKQRDNDEFLNRIRAEQETNNGL
jgi:hypothetical protein